MKKTFKNYLEQQQQQQEYYYVISVGAIPSQDLQEEQGLDEYNAYYATLISNKHYDEKTLESLEEKIENSDWEKHSPIAPGEGWGTITHIYETTKKDAEIFRNLDTKRSFEQELKRIFNISI